MSIERTSEAQFNSDIVRLGKSLAEKGIVPPKLKRNDVVKVYQKPMTDEKLEGKARLYQHHAQDNMSKHQSKIQIAAAVSSTPLLGITSNCLRCGTPCRLGTPDPKARAIVQASKEGFCPNCIITRFFLGIEVLHNLIEGTPARGDIVAARPGLGPEIFLNAEWREKTLRPVMRGLLAHTQMPEDCINWIEVVGNWGMPWPKGHEPKEMQ